MFVFQHAVVIMKLRAYSKMKRVFQYHVYMLQYYSLKEIFRVLSVM